MCIKHCNDGLFKKNDFQMIFRISQSYGNNFSKILFSHLF